MAIYQSSGIVTSISGRLNTSVFRNGPNAKVIAAAGRRIKRETENQQRVQAWMSMCAKQWSSLSAEDRLAWETSARTYSTVNRVGASRPKRGRELYAIWFWDQTAKQLDVPPETAGTPYWAFTITVQPWFLACSLTDGSPGQYLIYPLLPDSAVNYMEIFAARMLPHPETTPRSWRRMGTIYNDASGVDAWDLFHLPQNDWNLIPGENVAIKVVYHSQLPIWPSLQVSTYATVS